MNRIQEAKGNDEIIEYVKMIAKELGFPPKENFTLNDNLLNELSIDWFRVSILVRVLILISQCQKSLA